MRQIAPWVPFRRAASLLILAAVSIAAARGSDIDRLRLDQVRMLGSHNSYRPFPSSAAEARIRAVAPQYWPGLEYGHPPLEAQLALGLHQFEIDVAADPGGGRYAAPYTNATTEVQATMAAPGAKVIHFPPIDTEVHCLTFRLCLAIFARWSDAHPWHDPIIILVNSVDFPALPAGWPVDARFDQASIDALNADIAATIGRERVLAPDDVRGNRATLRAAVLAHAWPNVAVLRGKFVFVLDGSPAHEAFLRAGHSSLRGRLLFGWFDEAEPEAAFFNLQDPKADADQIKRLVHAGYIVRTRADADVKEARTRDGSRMVAALKSGAQLVSTDFYAGVPDPTGLGYTADFAGPMFRCDEVVTRCPRKVSGAGQR